MSGLRSTSWSRIPVRLRTPAGITNLPRIQSLVTLTPTMIEEVGYSVGTRPRSGSGLGLVFPKT